MSHLMACSTLALLALIGEAHAQVPEWASRLFPQTGPPTSSEPRLSRVSAAEFPVEGNTAGQVEVQFLYRDWDGSEAVGHAMVFLPPAVLTDPEARMGLFHAAGYEVDAGGASGWLNAGMVVVTPHAEALNPIARGPNLDTALLHAARALPFVDPGRVCIQGGSAGGYMTLMLASETFPLVCAMPDVPPVHWGYNAEYFLRNRELATAPTAEGGHAMPVLAVVLPLADSGAARIGMPTDSETWLEMSPLRHLDTITAPVQATFSTADMLVPIDQVSATFTRPRAEGAFPAGFTTDMAELVGRPEARVTLLDELPADSYEAFVIPAPADAGKLLPDGSGNPKHVAVPGPFSQTKQWSLLIYDEGPQEPDVGHLRYAMGADRVGFALWALGRGPDPSALTPRKLEQLMDRARGFDPHPVEIRPEGSAAPIVATRLDYPEAERADVLLGLRAFARDDACALRLAELYRQLSPERRLLGESLGETADAVRAAL